MGHRLLQSTIQKYLGCRVLDQEPSYLVDYSFNSYSNSNGTIDRIVGAFTNQKHQLLLTIQPQYIWIIDYYSQLSRSTYDAMSWTRNHLIWLTIASTLTPTQMAQLIGLGGHVLIRNLTIVDHPSTIHMGHRLLQSTIQKYLGCRVLDQEPSYLVDYSFNSYSNSNGTINRIVGHLLIRNLNYC
jgi:hypothetical protein